RALAACRRKCLPHAFGIEIGGVHWCSGLLPPGVIQSAGIDGIETEFVDKLQDDGFGLCIVARNGQGSSTRRSTRPTAFEQMARIEGARGRRWVTPRTTTGVPPTTRPPTPRRTGLVHPSRRMASLPTRVPPMVALRGLTQKQPPVASSSSSTA